MIIYTFYYELCIHYATVVPQVLHYERVYCIIFLRNRVCLSVFKLLCFVICADSCRAEPQGLGSFRYCATAGSGNSSDMTYPAVNDPNITSGFTFNERSVSLASELRCFVVLRPSPEQSTPSAARYNMIFTQVWKMSVQFCGSYK